MVSGEVGHTGAVTRSWKGVCKRGLLLPLLFVTVILAGNPLTPLC